MITFKEFKKILETHEPQSNSENVFEDDSNPLRNHFKVSKKLQKSLDTNKIETLTKDDIYKASLHGKLTPQHVEQIISNPHVTPQQLKAIVSAHGNKYITLSSKQISAIAANPKGAEGAHGALTGLYKSRIAQQPVELSPEDIDNILKHDHTSGVSMQSDLVSLHNRGRIRLTAQQQEFLRSRGANIKPPEDPAYATGNSIVAKLFGVK